MTRTEKVRRYRTWSNGAVFVMLVVFYRQHGRLPRTSELRGKDSWLPSSGLLRNRFGSVREAFTLAGLPLTPHHKAHEYRAER